MSRHFLAKPNKERRRRNGNTEKEKKNKKDMKCHEVVLTAFFAYRAIGKVHYARKRK